MVMTRTADTGIALIITPMSGRAGLRLVGEIDLATAPDLEAALDELLDGGGDVHLDLAELRFVDIKGAAVLVAAAARLAPDCSLVLHDPPPALCEIVDRFWSGVVRIRLDDS